MKIINIPNFVNKYVTKRNKSLFADDIYDNREILKKKIKGKAVLVIGGAGTIGSSYIKAILEFKPGKLFVVDINENSLTELTRRLRSDSSILLPKDFRTYPMNFGDQVFKKMFLNEGPFHIIANFAAHKHVRSEKDKYSIEAMIDNNVSKAKDLLDLMTLQKPECFFCVSTDKAANPVNVMGASKKLMEEVIMAYSNDLQITTARFANVAFSNGSLLAGYVERLFQNQPISCPSDVKRFFVSPEESGQICLLACMLGKSGEIFFPKLAEEQMTLFRDITIDFFNVLNRPIIECSSEEQAKERANTIVKGGAYPVYFFETDTSGEKLYEEFYTKDDIVNRDTYKGLGVIKNERRISKREVNEIISKLEDLMASDVYNKSAIVSFLKRHLTSFEHIETGKNLDQKM